jgi:hypothetical protein
VQVYAIVEDPQGIQHADFMVNGIIVYTQNVSIFTRRFDFSYIWQPDAPGTYNLLVIGYNRNGQGNPSLAHVLTVGGSAPTPIVIRITATPAFRIVTPEPPTLLAPTPYVLRVTATPDLSKLFTPFAPSPTPNVVIVPFGQ